MKLHGNARLTPVQRRLLCARVDDEGWTVERPPTRLGSANDGRMSGCGVGGKAIVSLRIDHRPRNGSRTARLCVSWW